MNGSLVVLMLRWQVSHETVCHVSFRFAVVLAHTFVVVELPCMVPMKKT